MKLDGLDMQIRW